MTSHPCSSARTRARALKSSRGDLSRLDVLGNLLIKRLGSNVETVVLVGRLGQSSHAGNTGNGLTVRDEHGEEHRRSFKQISKCNSPAPATMCSPDSEMKVNTQGSDLDRRLSLTSTATCMIENFTTFMLWAVSEVVRVLDINKNWPTDHRCYRLPSRPEGRARWQHPRPLREMPALDTTSSSGRFFSAFLRSSRPCPVNKPTLVHGTPIFFGSIPIRYSIRPSRLALVFLNHNPSLL